MPQGDRLDLRSPGDLAHPRRGVQQIPEHTCPFSQTVVISLLNPQGTRVALETTMEVLTSAPGHETESSGTRLKAVNRIFMALFDFSGLAGCFMVKKVECSRHVALPEGTSKRRTTKLVS